MPSLLSGVTHVSASESLLLPSLACVRNGEPVPRSLLPLLQPSQQKQAHYGHFPTRHTVTAQPSSLARGEKTQLSPVQRKEERAHSRAWGRATDVSVWRLRQEIENVIPAGMLPSRAWHPAPCSPLPPTHPRATLGSRVPWGPHCSPRTPALVSWHLVGLTEHWAPPCGEDTAQGLASLSCSALSRL